jgi:hypothetical protein
VGNIPNGGSGQGFLYSGGVYNTLNIPGAVGSQVSGINNLGQIVGTSPGTANGKASSIAGVSTQHSTYPEQPALIFSGSTTLAKSSEALLMEASLAIASSTVEASLQN